MQRQIMIDWIAVKINSTAIFLSILGAIKGNHIALSLSILASLYSLAYTHYKWRKHRKK
jgi:hypothetical protein